MAFQSFALPNGTTLKNRIVKSAMQELMADVKNFNQPSDALIKLYSVWGSGGTGLIISGNVMVDPMCMTASADPLLANIEELDEKRWRRLISASQQHGSQFYLQLNHPGRQQRAVKGIPVYAPSDIGLNIPGSGDMFIKPIPMSEEQILDVINRWTWTAKKAEELGANGIEIHAAHGYLISQFLSPLVNIRTDKWGGSIENRSRLLLEVVKAIRASVSPSFGVGIKINSSDFQKGGFNPEDLKYIIEHLNSMAVDFIEISGGSYEAPVMMDGEDPTKAEGNKGKSASTIKREAYFLEAAKELVQIAKMPVVVTGGIKTRSTLDTVLSSSPKLLAGVGTAMGLVPDLPNKWQVGEDPMPHTAHPYLMPKAIQGLGKTSAVHWNMRSIGAGSSQWLGVWPMLAFIVDEIKTYQQNAAYLKWVGKYAKSL